MGTKLHGEIGESVQNLPHSELLFKGKLAIPNSVIHTGFQQESGVSKSEIAG
jgi:hypothetical protein